MGAGLQAGHTRAVQEFGYTAREAEFIALTALHSGYFLGRQYSPHRGKLADALCKKVMASKHATARVFRGGTRLYHIHSKPLYRALGQEDNRHRKNQDSFHLRAKVMGLDYVLLHPHLRFLPTEGEKREFFTGLGLPASLFPARTYRGTDGTKTTRYFVEKYPIAVRENGAGVWFCYIDDGVFTAPSFSTWMEQYGPLIRAVEGAGIRYIATSEAAFVAARKEFLKQFPSSEEGIPPEMLEYFELRRAIGTSGLIGRDQAVLDRYKRDSRRFSEPRHEALFRSWAADKGREAAPSTVCLETFLLPFSYRFFGALHQRKFQWS